MIPRSCWWESMLLFFVQGSRMLSVFFWDHLFKGLLRLIHGFLSWLRCCCRFTECCTWLFFFLGQFFPFFLGRNDRCLRASWLNTCYYHWLTLFVQGCVFPMNNRFEGR